MVISPMIVSNERLTYAICYANIDFVSNICYTKIQQINVSIRFNSYTR